METVMGKKVNCEMTRFGYSIGVAADIGMMHKIRAFSLRYGVELDMPIVNMLVCTINMTGAVNASVSGNATSSIADAFLLTVSPYVSIGFVF